MRFLEGKMYGDSPDDHEEVYGMTMAEAMGQFNKISEEKSLSSQLRK